MIKIDFHIHTIPTSKDANFEFSLDKLEQYVLDKKLDAIAITNHNVFSKDNFNEITKRLNVKVFPGIEVDLEGGHILVIADPLEIDSFIEKSASIKEEFESKHDISIAYFKNIFSDVGHYLFIPHYDKKPKVPKQILSLLGSSIFCGEVGNPNKFIRQYKSEDEITPVIFSDFRPNDNITIFPNSQTYLDVTSIEFSTIKECLKDKKKVYLNNKRERSLFPILNDGTLASTGLNVIVGKRSTGKTYTIDHIFSSYSPQHIKYVRQFELIEKDSEKAEKEFNKSVSNKGAKFTDEYLTEFKNVVNSLEQIDLTSDEADCENYIASLKDYAIESDKLDSFAKVPLFKEQKYSIPPNEELPILIKATLALLESDKYKQLIENYVSRKQLIDLLCALNNEFISVEIERRKYQRTNLILDSVKKKLEVKSNATSVSTFDCLLYAKDKLTVDEFEKLVKAMKRKKIIRREEVGKFYIQAIRRPIESLDDLHSLFGQKGQFRELLKSYENPFSFFKNLRSLPQVKENDVYKGFFIIEYSILNENGYPVSGGQRAEFNLEQKLSDSDNCEMLLIDEPESSFDNIFLKKEIDSKIKELSQKMPVFISTHNNVVGASIKPDYILYTEMKMIDGAPVFKVYGGEAGAKELSASDGTKIKNYKLTMDCLEGGVDSYNERSDSYENIKD